MTRADMLDQAHAARQAAYIAAGVASHARARARRVALVALKQRGVAAYERMGLRNDAARWDADLCRLQARRQAPTTREVRTWALRLDAVEGAVAIVARAKDARS